MTRFESGPRLGIAAPDIEVYNHKNIIYTLDSLQGENGLLLGFSEDIWDLSSVRRVLWLQRQSYKLSIAGIKAALIMPNEPYELSGFYMSIPRQIPFPILADPKGEAFDAYHVEYPGFVLIDGDRMVFKKWFLQGDATPRMQDIIQTV